MYYYSVTDCYTIPVPDSSVDILTAALCIHWFDIDRFYAEVDRCLKPKGILAILTSGEGRFVVDGDVETVRQLNHFVTKVHEYFYFPFY